ncbi:MAG: GtrA family protein [Bacteroidetes bacterium]|nr:GtrA family protein [Bacteroidota bacterium]
MLRKARHIILGIIDFFYKPFSRFINKQTFRYLACGGSNTLFNIFLFSVSYNFILRKQAVHIGHSIVIAPYVASFIMAFVVTFPLGFLLSKFIVFQESNLHSRIQIFRYALLVTMCLLLNYIFIKIFVEWCHFYPTPSNVLTNIVVAIFSYISQRSFTFKVKQVPVLEEEIADTL